MSLQLHCLNVIAEHCIMHSQCKYIPYCKFDGQIDIASISGASGSMCLAQLLKEHVLEKIVRLFLKH